MTLDQARNNRLKSDTDAVTKRALEQFFEWKKTHHVPGKTLPEIEDAARKASRDSGAPLPAGVHPSSAEKK